MTFYFLNFLLRTLINHQAPLVAPCVRLNVALLNSLEKKGTFSLLCPWLLYTAWYSLNTPICSLVFKNEKEYFANPTVVTADRLLHAPYHVKEILKQILESSTIHGLAYISSAKVSKRLMLLKLLDHTPFPLKVKENCSLF